MLEESINKAELNFVKPNTFYNQVKSEDNIIILDVRSEEVSQNWELEFGGIETINYPYFNLLDNIPKELEKELPDNKEIIVVCSKGESSQLIADKLSDKGYNSTVLKDGTNGWSEVYEKRQIPTNGDMKLYQYIRPSSGCLGYMLVSKGEAVVIDPLKQYTDTYIEDAREQDTEIKYIIDTHIHADHVSGFKKLGRNTDATKIMYKNSKERGVDHSFKQVSDGDNIKFGNYSIEVLNTPGHTTDMTSYYVNDILFTGDSLFLNSIARPDLEDPDQMEDMTISLFNSITDIIELPEDTIIAPAHKFTYNPPLNDLNKTYTDYISNINDRLNLSEYIQDEFVEYIGTDMPPRPSNYAKIIDINKGIKHVSESKEYELELGPNNCSAS